MKAAAEVLNTSDFVSTFDPQKISDSIFEEVNYVADIFGMEQQITEKECNRVAKKVEKHIQSLNGNLQNLSGPLIREMVCGELKGRQRDFYTRVGLSIADAFKIDNAVSDVTHDNANQTKNAETKHKQKADMVARGQALLTIPQHLAHSHIVGDIHIHDLEYFTTRTFCINGNTAVPTKCDDTVSVIKPNELPFIDNVFVPENMRAFTPKGTRKIVKITRRELKDEEKLLQIKSSTGKSLKITKEHRIPVNEESDMVIKKACELELGNVLYNAASNELFNIRGKEIKSINLIKELTEKVPMVLLNKIYARNLNGMFNELSLTQSKFAKSLESLGVNDFKIRTEESWFDRGIMPISVFKKFIKHYNVKELDDVKIGVVGSKHTLSAIFPITSELVKILGYFVSEGNYNEGNLVITGNDFVSDVKAWSGEVFDSYATISESEEKITNILGHEGEWKRSKQVFFGGLLAVLIFKYVFKIPEGSVNKRLPNIVYNLNDELLRDFLSALFSGDGSAFYSVEKSSCTVSYTTTSEILRQELSLLLTTLGMNPGITKVPREQYEDLHRVLLSGHKNVNLINEWIEFHDEIKRQYIESFLLNVNETSTSSVETIKEISSVESSEDYVYDIFLELGKDESDHTFYASDGILIHNCMDWDLRFFFYYGLDPDCTGKTNIASAAMQPTVALLHAAKILGSAQTNFAGGQGFYNFLTFIAPYLEGLPYKEIKQLMQMFVFEISQTMVARGAQVVFSSIQVAPGVPKLWKDKPAVYKGVVWNGENGNEFRPYGDFEKEVRLAFRALMEVMHKGDAWGKLFNFPKPEIAFEKEFIIDHQDDEYFSLRKEVELAEHSSVHETEVPMTYSELYELVVALTIKFGTPYYDNMIPKYRQTEGISCYQCCAYSFNIGADSKNFDDKMYFRNGEHFSMGSNQVVSTNMPRAAYKVPKGDFDALEGECKRLIMEAIEVLEFKRDWISKLWYNGHIPFATQQLRHPVTKEVSPPAVDYEELVYTIGVIGMNEVAMHHVGGGLDTREGLFLNVKLLNRLTDFVHKQSEERGIKLVLARTPAESASQRFAISDLTAFPEEAINCVQGDIESAMANLKTSKNLPIYYSNGTHLPVNTNAGIIERMDIEGKFFQILDGGNIFHIWMGEEDPSPAALKEFIFKILTETNIGYFAFTKDFSICEPCGNQMNGIQTICTKCGSEDVKAYSRITGYIQDVSGWNAAKREELRQRTRLQGI